VARYLRDVSQDRGARMEARRARRQGRKGRGVHRLCGCIRAPPAGKRKSLLDRALNELLELFKDRVLPFDTDAARHYADLAVTAENGGRGFPTPDGYIAAVAASRGFIVASRDTLPYEAAGVTVINPWKDV